MEKILVTNIQRFSLHDGPGIRTTVFLKGCALHCPWCCNPENISPQIQKFVENGRTGTYGVWYTPAQLYGEIIKDRAFYQSELHFPAITSAQQLDQLPGGVTFSGGEALLQMHRLEPLLRDLRRENIHITVETSLFVPKEQVHLALNYVDLFYVDIKLLDAQECCEHLGGDLALYLSNLALVLDSGKPVIFRIPVIGGYTDSIPNRKRILELLKTAKGNILKVELLKEHNLGEKKYQSLIAAGNNITHPPYRGVETEALESFRTDIQKVLNVPVELCKI